MKVFASIDLEEEIHYLQCDEPGPLRKLEQRIHK